MVVFVTPGGPFPKRPPPPGHRSTRFLTFQISIDIKLMLQIFKATTALREIYYFIWASSSWVNNRHKSVYKVLYILHIESVLCCIYYSCNTVCACRRLCDDRTPLTLCLCNSRGIFRVQYVPSLFYHGVPNQHG